HLVAEGQGRQLDRHRAGGDDDRLGADHLRAGLGLDLDGLAVAEARAALYRLDARPLQQAGDAGVEPADDAVLPGDGLGHVDGRGGERDAARVVPLPDFADLEELVRRVDQRFGGDAADIQTGAAGLARLDDHRIQPELAGAAGTDIEIGRAP